MNNVGAKQLDEIREKFGLVTKQVSKVMVGNEEVITNVITCLLARGHVLLEGIPGVGKTKLVQTLANVLNLTFSRIQFTPDLMPGDILGTNVVKEDEQGKKSFQFQQGPIFANMILADEINRATPKTQSALLEAMQENSVSAGGKTLLLDQPVFVLATQNPIEMEGTYPLPEAQMDRFLFKLKLDFPNAEELHTIVERTTKKTEPDIDTVLGKNEILGMRDVARDLPIAKPIQDYAVRLALATHPERNDVIDSVKQYVRFGVSPRGIQAIVLGAKVHALFNGRSHVACEDVRSVLLPSLRHRVLLNFEAEAEQIETDSILGEILQTVPEA